MARIPTSDVSRCRAALLVARDPAVAFQREMAAVVRSLVPVSRNAALRRPLGILRLLRSHHLSPHLCHSGASPEARLSDQVLGRRADVVLVTVAYLVPAIRVVVQILSPLGEENDAEGASALIER